MLRWSSRNVSCTAVAATAPRMAAVAAVSSSFTSSSFSSNTANFFSTASSLSSPALVSSFHFNSELATSNPNLAPQTAGGAGDGSSASGATTESLTAAATEVAKRVNATKRAHQTATGDERKRLEQAAWNDLNTLTEDQIANADGQATAILLNAWGYFARFWARGKDGPL